MSDFLPRFKPAARIETVPLHPVHRPGPLCLAVDERLLNPEVLVALAVTRRAHFQDRHASANPGRTLWLPSAVSSLLDEASARMCAPAWAGRVILSPPQ